MACTTFLVNFKEERISIAVGADVDWCERITTCGSLSPQLVAGATPEVDASCAVGQFQALLVEIAQHQNLSSTCILHDAGIPYHDTPR